MISTTLALASAALSMQATDTNRAREGLSRCFGTFVERAIRAHMSLTQFEAEFPQACRAEQAAFRAAVIQRAIAASATRDSAEVGADIEVEDVWDRFIERFERGEPTTSH
jgi:hypothetical protein